MLSVEKSNKNNVFIRGDFWDFDRLYFAIFKFVGDYAMEKNCPFPGYDDVCESLLGICYEIRKAKEGKRELYEQYNGIDEEMFEKNSKVEKTEDTTNFYEYFSRKHFPNTTTTNTLLQFQISFPEALYYALICRELLEKKELFLKQRKELTKDDTLGMKELNIEYYYCQAHTDLARITIYMESTLRILFHLIGKDDYIHYIHLFSTKTDGFLNCDLQYCNALVTKYSKENFNTSSSKHITAFLDELYLALCK